METRTIVLLAVGGVSLLAGGTLIARTVLSGDPGPTAKKMEGAMSALDTNDLIARRQFMAAQIEQARQSVRGEPGPMLLSAEASLAELDAALLERGIDPESLGKADRIDIVEAVEQAEP